MPGGVAEVEGRVREIVSRWRDERAERQARPHLDRADLLREAGLLALAAPVDSGGLRVSNSVLVH